tara:strand:- start:4941 stop:5444 length:504 start_codon:yes stop_codon:yes gene_type:complete
MVKETIQERTARIDRAEAALGATVLEDTTVYGGLTDEDLLDRLVLAREDARDAQKAADIMEHEYVARLDASGREQGMSSTNVAELKRTRGYDQPRLVALGELLPPEVKAEVYAEPTSIEVTKTVTTPGGYDMKKVGRIVRVGGNEAAAIIEAARFVRTQKLVTKTRD